MDCWIIGKLTLMPITPSIHHSIPDRRVVHGEKQTHLTQNQAALDVQVVSRRPFSTPSKHCQRCIRSVSEFSSVQFRVRAPI